MAHHDEHGHPHTSADDEYGATPPGSTYEHTDATVGIIVKFLAWLAVSAVIIHFGLGFLYAMLINRSMETGEQRYPLAAGQEQRLPPAPRLQQFPANDIYEYRMSEQSLLQNYGYMNRDAGVVHIPISEAMRLMVDRGLLSHAEGADGGPAAPPTAGMMPADSSGGQTMERRR